MLTGEKLNPTISLFTMEECFMCPWVQRDSITTVTGPRTIVFIGHHSMLYLWPSDFECLLYASPCSRIFTCLILFNQPCKAGVNFLISGGSKSLRNLFKVKQQINMWLDCNSVLSSSSHSASCIFLIWFAQQDCWVEHIAKESAVCKPRGDSGVTTVSQDRFVETECLTLCIHQDVYVYK